MLSESEPVQLVDGSENSFDVMTPDSGIHDDFANMTTLEQGIQRDKWREELTKTEDEIQTLRQVLASKVKKSQDLKRRLGVTVWQEFSEDFSSSLKSVKESPTYQKTAGAMSAVGEKTAGIFGGIGAKFGALKETPTFKSFEERVGSVYTTAKVNLTPQAGEEEKEEEGIKEADIGDKQADKQAKDEPNKAAEKAAEAKESAPEAKKKAAQAKGKGK